MITQAIQDYLKVIYKISETGQIASTNAIAARLRVSQPSVTGMLKKLAEIKLISYTPYQGVKLTAPGRKIALEIIRHHRLLELYLAKAMGYSWDKVHQEAEKLEHFISEEFEQKMAEILGEPTSDPHGAPIPAKNGKIQKRNLSVLSSVKTGEKVTIKQVSDRDPEKLRYLAQIGILPDIVVVVSKKAPFEGPISVKIGKKQHHLGRALTDQIFVEKL
jgi:DtxR family Mn-dependent transcriptional regulator